jgi:uncharacterized membrane protein
MDQKNYVNRTPVRKAPEGGPAQPQGDNLARPLPPLLAEALRRFPFLRRHPHPALAHFAIVFMLATTFFTVLYLVTGNRSFDDTAFYCLAGGVLTLPLAIATGLFTFWLNFSGQEDRNIRLEKKLSYLLLILATGSLVWRWLNPQVLDKLKGANLLYLLIILALTPLVTVTSYFGGMLTFPLEEQPTCPGPEQNSPRGIK